MRKISYFLLLIMLLVGACSKTSQSEKIKVSFWHGTSGPIGDVLSDMIKDFEKSHPDIDIVAIPVSSYAALSQKLMASIQANKQPDIAQVYESWTAKYIDAGVLVSLQDMIAKDPAFGDEDLADIYPVFLKSNTFNDTLYSFPFNKSVRAYFYNKDAFYRAGLDPNYFPKTWQEFREYCQKLTDKVPQGSKPNHYGTNYAVNEWQFINLLHQAGGSLLDQNGKPALNSSYGLEALNFITDLIHTDGTVYTVSGYEGQNDFLAGKVAMYEGSSVSITHMRQEPINFNMGYAPLPTYRTNNSAVSGTNIVIFKSGDTRREQAAWEFIKWFTDTEQTAEWATRTFYMPVRRSAMNSSTIQEFLTQYPQFRAIFEQLESAVYEPQIAAWFKARPKLKEFLEEAIARKKDNRTALNGAAQMFQDYMDE